jgi:hypothetical protein
MKHPSTIRDDLPNASGRTPASVSSLDERELQDYLVSRLAASDRRVLYICFGNTDLAAKIEACTGAEVTVVDGYSRSGSQIPSSRDRAIKCDIDSIVDCP